MDDFALLETYKNKMFESNYEENTWNTSNYYLRRRITQLNNSYRKYVMGHTWLKNPCPGYYMFDVLVFPFPTHTIKIRDLDLVQYLEYNNARYFIVDARLFKTSEEYLNTILIEKLKYD